MRAGEGKQHLVRLEIGAFERWEPWSRSVLVLLRDGDVERAAGEQRQRLLRLGLDQLDPQARVHAGEVVDGRHGERRRGGLERGDADRAAHPIRLGRELGLDLLDAREQLARALDERAPRVGQLEPPADLAKQLHARLALELGELL